MILDDAQTLCYKSRHLLLGGSAPSPCIRSACPWPMLAVPCGFCQGHNSSAVFDTPRTSCSVWRGTLIVSLFCMCCSIFLLHQGGYIMSATRPIPRRLLCSVSLILWLVCGLHITDSPAQPKGKM